MATAAALVVLNIAFPSPQDAVRRGIRNLDFLRGQEPYKYWWGSAGPHDLAEAADVFPEFLLSDRERETGPLKP